MCIRDRWKELTVDRREAAAVVPVEPLTRPQFLRFTAADAQTAAAVPDYSVSGDLHEITNLEWMEWNGLSDTTKAILAQNLFCLLYTSQFAHSYVPVRAFSLAE